MKRILPVATRTEGTSMNPIWKRRLSWGLAAGAFFGACLCAFGQGHGKVVYWSPDEALQTIVVPVVIQEPDFHEHTVEIRTRDGRMLCKADHTSEDHEHGRCVISGAWSPDSNFFAYSTTSSGGHSSWHSDTFCYNRKENAVFALDEMVGGPLVGASVLFTTPAVFHSKRLNYDAGEKIAPEPIAVRTNLNLVKFERKFMVPDKAAKTKPPPASLPKDQSLWDLYEMAFRKVLPQKPDKEAVFLSFGWDGDRKVYRDPPEGFLQRFADLPYRVQPVSAARMPRFMEKTSKDTYRGVEDRSGRKARVYYVEIMSAAGRVTLLKAGFTGGPLYGGGQEYEATLEKRKWKLTGTGNSWVE